MPAAAPKSRQIAERKNGAEEKEEISASGIDSEGGEGDGVTGGFRLPVRLDLADGTDSLPAG
jgi:hypothetical protein